MGNWDWRGSIICRKPYLGKICIVFKKRGFLTWYLDHIQFLSTSFTEWGSSSLPCSLNEWSGVDQFSSVQSLSRAELFAIPWIAACQASMSVHRVGDAIQPSHPLSSPSPPAPNPSQHQSLFQWVNSSHKVAKVLEFQLQQIGNTNTQWPFCVTGLSTSCQQRAPESFESRVLRVCRSLSIQISQRESNYCLGVRDGGVLELYDSLFHFLKEGEKTLFLNRKRYAVTV